MHKYAYLIDIGWLILDYKKPMDVVKTEIPEVLIIEPKVFGDRRGFFLETFRLERYAAQGLRRPFVQDNLSRSSREALRDLIATDYPARTAFLDPLMHPILTRKSLGKISDEHQTP